MSLPTLKIPLEQAVRYCVRCGFCKALCPTLTANQQKEAYGPRGRMLLARGLITEELKATQKFATIFYMCTLCGACEVLCLAGLETERYFMEIRNLLFEKYMKLPEVEAIAKNIMEKGNVVGRDQSERFAWLKNKAVLDKKDAEVLLWIGCMSAFRIPELGEAITGLFDKLGINYAILSQETCCGDPLILLGAWSIAKENAKRVIDTISKLGIKKLVTGCAGCYHAFKRLWPEVLGIEPPFEVYHLTQYLAKLIDEGRVRFSREVKMRVFYHDPCEIGRRCKVYEEPRKVIKAIPGIELVESPYSKDKSLCCGGGGGVFALFTDKAIEMATDRIKRHVLPLNVNAIITACPACYINMKYAIEMQELKLEIYDIAQLLLKAL